MIYILGENKIVRLLLNFWLHGIINGSALEIWQGTLVDLLGMAGRRPWLPMVVCCSTRDELDAVCSAVSNISYISVTPLVFRLLLTILSVHSHILFSIIPHFLLLQKEVWNSFYVKVASSTQLESNGLYLIPYGYVAADVLVKKAFQWECLLD